jgi:hypothetical protein
MSEKLYQIFHVPYSRFIHEPTSKWAAQTFLNEHSIFYSPSLETYIYNDNLDLRNNIDSFVSDLKHLILLQECEFDIVEVKNEI